MGHVKIDTERQARTYTQKYSLSTIAGVKALLADRHRIAARRFRGDTAASDILIDLHSAIESAGLTDRQAEAIGLVYGFDLTQQAAADVMGVDRVAVTQFIGGAADRIAAVYRKWNYGEITVEFESSAEGNAANDEANR